MREAAAARKNLIRQICHKIISARGCRGFGNCGKLSLNPQ